MADSSRTIMTDAGFALETRVRADETKMQFTRATISTDDHFSDTDDALAKLTELSNIQQDGKVTAVQVINTTTVYVQVDVNQAESKADYQMRSAALYAKDDDGTEVLYGVTVLQDPVFVHKDADGSYLGFGINTTVGRASNVVVVVDPANMVTQQVFESTMKNYYTKAEVDAKFVTDDDFASKLPKNIATTDAANTFAKSQTLAGGATDGKGNAYATTKDVANDLNNGLSTKVNVTDTANWQKQAMSLPSSLYLGTNPAGTKFATYVNANFNNAGVYYIRDNNAYAEGADHALDVTLLVEPGGAWKYAFGVSWGNGMYYRSITPNGDSGWKLVANDSAVVHTKDMRKPANDVAGIDEVNAKQDKLTITPADDSKVAHLSGANNFDTVPTVNNNPLLLASSLPSDLARTSQDANFTGKLQKSGVDVATVDDVSAKQDKLDYTPANDANVVHRNPDTGVVSEPTDFTNLTVNGGKSVATSDDLKSLEASAWRPLTLANSTSGTILFKDNGDGTASLIGSATFTIAKGTTTLTPVITPPTGYTFTSLKWSKGINNKGVYVTRNMTGVSSGTSYVFDTSLSNGDICFLGSSDDIYTVTFSPSELTTLNTAAACNPALVSISKV